MADGCEVLGIDCFSDYYDPALKRSNLARLKSDARFRLVEADVTTADLDGLLEGVNAVFHQAGQPGVRASWGLGFEPYVRQNILATQRLLEACLRRATLKRFVFASSSSVYGDADELPAREATLPRPVSPYGVTKLAAEHLCLLYAKLGVPTVSLRYFTVYGPRQRPDMAFNQFIHALFEGEEIVINGDGEQTRDFTYVDDIVAANVAAATVQAERVVGRVYNLGGGSRVSVNEVIRLLETVTGQNARVRHRPQPPGEARHTFADTSAARRDLGFEPLHDLEAGLRAEAEWISGELVK